MINRNKGGRPSKYEVMRLFIPAAINKLGKARPYDLQKMYEKDIGRNITDDTIRKYCEIFVEEGILRKQIEIDNSGSGNRNWQMIWYLLE